MSVLADDGGGVPQLAVVVTAAAHAGHLADGGREHHLDAPRVVAHCGRGRGAHQGREGEKEAEEEVRINHPLIHRCQSAGFCHF